MLICSRPSINHVVPRILTRLYLISYLAQMFTPLWATKPKQMVVGLGKTCYRYNTQLYDQIFRLTILQSA